MMKLRDYKPDLIERLKDKSYAAEYLAQVLEEQDPKAFLLAIRNVADAMGGVGKLSERLSIDRQGAYKALSENGNPRLSTLNEILEALGLRLTICAK